MICRPDPPILDGGRAAAFSRSIRAAAAIAGQMLTRPLALAAALAALVLGTSEAGAYVQLQLVEPAGGDLDFGTVEALTPSAPQRIRIKNVGTTEPDIFWTDIWGTSPSFTVVAQGGSLAPGDSYYWDVIVTPRPDEVQLGADAVFELEWRYTPTDDDGFWPVPLECAVTPTPYAGARQHLYVASGSSATLTVPVTNASSVPRQITAVAAASGPFAAQLHGGAAPITVAPGASFWVDVTFAPSSVPSAFHRTSVLVFDTTGPHGAFLVDGLTVATPLAFSTAEVVFGDTFPDPDPPLTASFQITNLGSAPAGFTSAEITGAGFSLVSNPHGILPPGGSATYVVAFEPHAVGELHGVLTVHGIGQVALSGQGVPGPVSTAAELDLGVAFVGASVRSSISLHNAGTTAITVSSLELSDPRFSVVSTDRTIPPLGDLVVELEYAPTAPGEVVASLAIALDADPDPQLTVTLRGAGISLEPPTDPAPIEPPLSFAPGAAPADPAPGGAGSGAGGCSTPGGSGSLAALALALVPVFRRRRRSSMML